MKKPRKSSSSLAAAVRELIPPLKSLVDKFTPAPKDKLIEKIRALKTVWLARGANQRCGVMLKEAKTGLTTVRDYARPEDLDTLIAEIERGDWLEV